MASLGYPLNQCKDVKMTGDAVLSAQCKVGPGDNDWRHSEIDLKKCVDVIDGKLQAMEGKELQYGIGFFPSSENVRLEGYKLKAKCCDNYGEMHDRELDLEDHVRSLHGVLIFVHDRYACCFNMLSAFLMISNRTWGDAILGFLGGIRGGGGPAFSPAVTMMQNAAVAQAIEEKFQKTPAGEMFEGDKGYWITRGF